MGAEHAKMTKKGFTLVELVVVIAILAIIAAIAIPIVSNIIGSANSNTDANNAKSIELTLKEANSLIDVGITSFYTNGTNTTVKEVFDNNGFKPDTIQKDCCYVWVKGQSKVDVVKKTTAQGTGYIKLTQTNGTTETPKKLLVTDLIKDVETVQP